MFMSVFMLAFTNSQKKLTLWLLALTKRVSYLFIHENLGDPSCDVTYAYSELSEMEDDAKVDV